MYQENNIDIQSLMQVMFQLQMYGFIIVSAYLAPWIPFFWTDTMPLTNVFESFRGSGILSQTFTRTIYKESVLN